MNALEIAQRAWASTKKPSQPEFDSLLADYRLGLVGRVEAICATGTLSDDEPYLAFEQKALDLHEGVVESSGEMNVIDDVQPIVLSVIGVDAKSRGAKFSRVDPNADLVIDDIEELVEENVVSPASEAEAVVEATEEAEPPSKPPRPSKSRKKVLPTPDTKPPKKLVVIKKGKK